MGHVDFSWKSDLGDVPYRIGIFFSETPAMDFPTVNVSNVGFVPTKWQLLRLHLKCSEMLTSEVNLTLQVDRKCFNEK